MILRCARDDRYLHDLPAHSWLTVEFVFLAIDTWDGETGTCKVDGAAVWTEAFTFTTSTLGNLCGKSTASDHAKAVTVDFAHFGQGASLVFGATIDQACVTMRIINPQLLHCSAPLRTTASHRTAPHKCAIPRPHDDVARSMNLLMMAANGS